VGAAKSDQCSWSISASPGQRIVVTLYDFTTSRTNQNERRTQGSESMTSSMCAVLAVFEERGRPRFSLNSCRVRLGKQVVYTSHGPRLNVSIHKGTEQHLLESNFLFHYQGQLSSHVSNIDLLLKLVIIYY